MAWDRYAYTNNNPLRYSDPSGHCGVDPYDDYYDYDCHKLAQDVSNEFGLPYHQIDQLEIGTIEKAQKVLQNINATRQIMGDAPLNFSLPEITLYQNTGFEIWGGLRVYYQAGGTVNSNGMITISPNHTDIGPWSVGPATLDYQLGQSWIDNASTALNLGIPDLPIDPFSLDVSVNFSRRSGNVIGTNTIGVEFKARTDRIATVTTVVGIPAVAVAAPEAIWGLFAKLTEVILKQGMAY